MSGDLHRVQDQMVTSEFVETIKYLSSVKQSSGNYVDRIELMHDLLKRATVSGLRQNQPFALAIVENLHHIVPIFDTLLSTNDQHGYLQASQFLEKLSSSLDGLCLLEVFSKVNDGSHLNKIFQLYVNLLKEKYFSDDDRYDNLAACVMPIIGLSSLLISLDEEKIPTNLFTTFLTFVQRHRLVARRQRIITCVLGMMKAFSKKPTLVPAILRTGWPSACIQWLINADAPNGSRTWYSFDHYLCLILQKLSRHTIGVEALNKLNCLKALEQAQPHMQRDYSESEYSCLYFIHCMIYALLTESDEIKQISMLTDTCMLKVLDQLVTFTISASRAENFLHGCFHVSEIVTVLSKLFVNDDILKTCFDGHAQLFDCLCQLIVHFAAIINDTRLPHQPVNDETILVLTNVLWSISFHPSYHTKFRSNTTLMHTLANLATASTDFKTQYKSIPRDLSSLKKAAEGILWNLKSSSAPASEPHKEKIDAKPLAMISYSHSDSTFCRELVERLSGYVPVWVDYKQASDTVAHSDDLWEEIARAMEIATVIVLIVSKEYYDSKSCRQELSYASDILRKRIVPIYAPNQQYRASGWLGIRIAGQKYIHFGRKLFADGVQELASLVANDQKKASAPAVSLPLPELSSTVESGSCSPPSVHLPVKMPHEENKLHVLKDWTREDILAWFKDNHIHENLTALFADRFRTGTALVVYSRHLKYFYRNEYVRIYAKYYELFDGHRLDTFEFVNLVDAFHRLRLDNDPHSQTEDHFDKTANVHSLPKNLKSADEGMTWL